MVIDLWCCVGTIPFMRARAVEERHSTAATTFWQCSKIYLKDLPCCVLIDRIPIERICWPNQSCHRDRRRLFCSYWSWDTTSSTTLTVFAVTGAHFKKVVVGELWTKALTHSSQLVGILFLCLSAVPANRRTLLYKCQQQQVIINIYSQGQWDLNRFWAAADWEYSLVRVVLYTSV